MIGIPTVEEVRAWVQVPASALPDDDLQQILDAELALQARVCRVPYDPDPDTGEEAVYPDPLVRSVLRRCQRQIAARNLPLGVIGAEGTEYGPLQLRTWDSEVSRLEASYRQVVIS